MRCVVGRQPKQKRREGVAAGAARAAVGHRRVEAPQASRRHGLLHGEHPVDRPAAHLDAVRAHHFGDRTGELIVVVLSHHRDERGIADRRVAGRPHLEPGYPARDRIARVVHVLEPEFGRQVARLVRVRTARRRVGTIEAELQLRDQWSSRPRAASWRPRCARTNCTARSRCRPCLRCCRSDRWSNRQSWWPDTGSASRPLVKLYEYLAKIVSLSLSR